MISPITSAITGIGWISQREYGCVMKSLRRPYLDMGSLRSELQGQSILSYPLKRFGKYDLVFAFDAIHDQVEPRAPGVDRNA